MKQVVPLIMGSFLLVAGTFAPDMPGALRVVSLAGGAMLFTVLGAIWHER